MVGNCNRLMPPLHCLRYKIFCADAGIHRGGFCMRVQLNSFDLGIIGNRRHGGRNNIPCHNRKLVRICIILSFSAHAHTFVFLKRVENLIGGAHRNKALARYRACVVRDIKRHYRFFDFCNRARFKNGEYFAAYHAGAGIRIYFLNRRYFALDKGFSD